MVPVAKKININFVYIVLIDYIIICIFGGGGNTFVSIYLSVRRFIRLYIYIINVKIHIIIEKTYFCRWSCLSSGYLETY